MNTTDTIIISAFVILIVMLGYLVFRSRKAPKISQRIADGQAHSLKLQERQIEAQERQISALERIAEALEKR